MQIISNTALISINETLIVQLISFLIFLFIINRIMFRPLQSSMAERNVYVTDLAQEISKNESEISQILKEIQSKETAVRQEANTLQTALEDEGSHEAEHIFDQAQQEISDLMKRTNDEIRAKIEAAKQYVADEAEILAVSVVEKLLDRRMVS